MNKKVFKELASLTKKFYAAGNSRSERVELTTFITGIDNGAVCTYHAQKTEEISALLKSGDAPKAASELERLRDVLLKEFKKAQQLFPHRPELHDEKFFQTAFYLKKIATIQKML